jgi:hypothetical protein
VSPRSEPVATGDIWTAVVDTAAADLDGHTVAAPDGEVGVVDGRRSDLRRGWLVVDVPLRFTRRSVVVPAGIVERVDVESRTLLVGVSRAYVVDGPDVLDADDAVLEDVRTDVAVYYASVIASGAHVLPSPGYTFHPRRPAHSAAPTPKRDA